MRKRRFTKRVRQVDLAAIRLDEEGFVRFVGSQLYWILEIAKVSIPVAARYLQISDNTLYRHIMAEADIKSSLNSKCEAFISLLAYAVRDGALPLLEGEEEVMLQGNDAHNDLAQIVSPYVSSVVPPIIAESILTDYVQRYHEAREQVQERIRNMSEAEAAPHSHSPGEVTPVVPVAVESDPISHEGLETESSQDQVQHDS